MTPPNRSTRILHLTTLLAVGCFAAQAMRVSAAETEWPQFRGPTGQGISQATKVPVQWSNTEGVAWSVEVPGHGWSSPVLSKGRLYLTSAVTDATTGDVTLHAFCVNAADGHILWDTEVLHPDPALVAAMHRKNTPASATPIVTSDRLYVHFGHMGTAALDLAGKIVWRQTELVYPPTHGNGGSPILLGDELIFSADGQKDPSVIALDAATGALRWKTARNSPAKKQFSFSTPLAIDVGGVKEVISPGPGFVGAYAPADGRELWRVAYGEGYSVVPRPVFAFGLLFLSSGFDRPTFYAIKPEGAAGDVTTTNVTWSLSKGAPLTPSAVVVGDEIYFVSDAGIATCATARTGDVLWSERLKGNFSASPVAIEGRIYFQNETGVGFVVKAAPTYELLATNDLGERSLASYAVADGALYIRTEGHLWKIGR
jgi:outer membrane protein assembly factor BamB